MPNKFTIVVSHFVKAGKEEKFEQALKQVIETAKSYYGYEGIQIIKVNNTLESEYILYIRFDTESNYQVWAESTTRKEWFEELKKYIIRESNIRHQEGLEFWFSLPQTHSSKPPKKWKMALLTWMVIYPSVLAFSTMAGIYLDFMPAALRLLLVSMLLVSLMTYLIMPKITSVFASWIFKRS